MRAASRLPLCTLCLSGACLAAVVPTRVSGSMTGSADVTDHASGRTDTESFETPIRATQRDAATTQRTRTASLDGQTAQAWSQCDAGPTAAGGLRAGVMSYAAQNAGSGTAKSVEPTSCQREAETSTTQVSEFKVTGRAQPYRFQGTITGAQEPGVADSQQKRAGTVRLVSDAGVVHEFTATQDATSTSFDTSGTLEPGTYRVEVTTRARAESGRTRSADPMIASVQWTLEPAAPPAQNSPTAVAQRK